MQLVDEAAFGQGLRLARARTATAQIGRPGAGPFSLTGQPSACGTAREVGTFSHRLPADMVVSCVGTVPNTAWLRDNNPLLCNDGSVIRDGWHNPVPVLSGCTRANSGGGSSTFLSGLPL